MQKLLIGAVVGGMAGLVIGVVFAAGGLLVTEGLVDHAGNVIGLCGGVAGFAGMFIGALSGATQSVGGGDVKACVAGCQAGKCFRQRVYHW